MFAEPAGCRTVLRVRDACRGRHVPSAPGARRLVSALVSFGSDVTDQLPRSGGLGDFAD